MKVNWKLINVRVVPYRAPGKRKKQMLAEMAECLYQYICQLQISTAQIPRTESSLIVKREVKL